MELPIRPGVFLAHYEILAAIGRGGMGEVWKARDTKLHREVAVKALPSGLAVDPDGRARLEREARALAALNHPNIAAIYGLEESAGNRFLVLELVEGPTLAERMQQGPMSPDEALRLALQIAESVEAAHEKGIVHRDLKPANIKVSQGGRIKVLDFGLARVLESQSGNQTTLTALTGPSVAVGTPAYMSPEQARGEVVNQQSDIWSFGVVLYQLLTGASPFSRPTTVSTLAAVNGAEPDYDALPATADLRRLLRRCLEKEPRRRFQHMGDVRIELEDLLAPLSAPVAERVDAAGARQTSRRLMLVAVLLILASLGAGVWVARNLSLETPAIAFHLSHAFRERPLSQPFGTRKLAISPDGLVVAYSSARGLWLKLINQMEAVSLAEGYSSSSPFFSPDGKWVGFFDDDRLYKSPVQGGAVTEIVATTGRPFGATWGRGGTIVFATSAGLYRVSENGGESQPLALPDRKRKEQSYSWPHFLPGGRTVAFTMMPEGTNADPEIALLDLETREITSLLKGASSAVYVPTGHLVFVHGPDLKAIKFDVDTKRTSGERFSFPQVLIATALDNGASDFAVSDTGTLVYLSPSETTDGLRTLVWKDRQGNEEPLPVEPMLYADPRFSPAGDRVALDIRAGGNRDIYVLDLERLSRTRVTAAPLEDLLPIWRDDKTLLFSSNRTGDMDIYSQAADGASDASLVFSAPKFQAPQLLTPDLAQVIVYDDFRDTKVLNLANPAELIPLLDAPEFDQRLPSLSQDGKWLAYESDEAGNQFEVYLRPYPNVKDQRLKISIDGGRYPLWGLEGSRELFYVNLSGEMMAVSLSLSPTPRVVETKKLFDWERPGERSGKQFDISPRNGRFIMVQPVAERRSGLTQVSIVVNWIEELSRQLPGR